MRIGAIRHSVSKTRVPVLQHAAQAHARAQKFLRIDRVAIDARFVTQIV
jgi:hypothetical protein